MKSFRITEPQLQELAGRLNALTLQGLQNAALLAGIEAVLAAVASQPVEPPAPVVKRGRSGKHAN